MRRVQSRSKNVCGARVGFVFLPSLVQSLSVEHSKMDAVDCVHPKKERNIQYYRIITIRGIIIITITIAVMITIHHGH